MDRLEVDNVSLFLGVVIVLALVAHVLTRPPAPQLHPFLLGRQSIASPTRLESQSPVYKNALTGSGFGGPSVRPDPKIRLLHNILKGSLSRFEGPAQGTWVKGGEKVWDVVRCLRLGLLNKIGSTAGEIKPSQTGDHLPVVIYISDPTDALLVVLALALTTYRTVVLDSSAESGDVSEIFRDQNGIIICSEELESDARRLFAKFDNWIVLGGSDDSNAEDFLTIGQTLFEDNKDVPIPDDEPIDDVVSFQLGNSKASKQRLIKFTHQNLTASLMCWLSVFPPSASIVTRPSVHDFVLSLHHPSTPYGFGLALFCIYSSASVRFPSLRYPVDADSIEFLLSARSSPPVTTLFGSAPLISNAIYKVLLSKMAGDSAFVIKHSRNGKLALLREGTISNSTWWDKLLFSGVRKEAKLDKLKSLVLEGSIEQSQADFFRITLGVPVISTLKHREILCPITSTMPLDFQRLCPPGTNRLSGKEHGHVGPPVSGMEMKLLGVEEEIQSGRVHGEIVLRSPSLSTFDSPKHKDSALPSLPPHPPRYDKRTKLVLPQAVGSHSESEGSIWWYRTGIQAEMGREGTVWLAAPPPT